MIYGEYAKTTGFMSAENLVEFLMKEQREKASLVNALKIIESCEPDDNGQCLRSCSWFKLVYLSQEDGQRLVAWVGKIREIFFFCSDTPHNLPPPATQLKLFLWYMCVSTHCVSEAN